ncbi:MAG: hypothetical protein JW726_16630 [Anaerolineales bacterium]|nr:hypothetical protein [Anaerolineales bacterium]
MKKRAFWIYLAIVFIASLLILSLVFRDEVTVWLVVPALRAYDNIRRVVHSNSQEIWGLFIALLYFLILMSLPQQQNMLRSILRADGKGRSYMPPGMTSYRVEAESGRLTFWHHEVRRLHHQPFLTRFSVVELRKLVLDTVAFREGCSRHEAELWLEENEKAVPEAVMMLLHIQPGSQLRLTADPLSRLWRMIREFLLGVRTETTGLTNQQKIDQIIQFLEIQKEIVHDDRII